MRADLVIKNIISKSMLGIGFLMILMAGSSVDTSCDYKKIIAFGLVGIALCIGGKKFWEY